jgi:hypothetical protein
MNEVYMHSAAVMEYQQGFLFRKTIQFTSKSMINNNNNDMLTPNQEEPSLGEGSG